MSLNDPKKLISLMSELSDLLESWNINISDDNVHTQSLKAEDISVADNADHELSRSVEVTQEDEATIAKSKENSEYLLNRGKSLLEQVEPVLEQANQRVRNGEEVLATWKKNYSNSRDWYEIAQEEYERSVNEYNKAVEDYNESLPALESASRSLDSCHRSQTTDKNGRVTPSCDSEYREYKRCLEITERLKAIMNEKREVMERAKVQYELSAQCLETASKMCQTADSLLAKSRELLDLSNSAYRNANDAISAASSALELDRLAEKDNTSQQDFNTESTLHYNRVKTALSNVYTAFNTIMDTSDSCERLNALMRSDMESKSSLLCRFSGVNPDSIMIKK